MTKNVFAPIVLTLVLALSGCGGGSDSKPDSSEQSDSAEVSSSTNTSKEKADTENSPSKISEQILLEQDGIRITAKESELKQSSFGPEIAVLIENDSDKNITVQCNNVSCNGFMVEPLFSSDIAAGKKVNDSITLSESDLKNAGIGKIGVVELNLVVINSDSWDHIVETEPIVIKTSNAETYQETLNANTDGAVLLEDSGIKIKYQGISDDSIFGKDILLYIENTSSENLTIQSENLSINGFMVDSIFSCDISAGKAAYDGITLMSSDLEENEITDIEEIELSFVIINADSFDRISTSSPISISLNNN